MGGINLRLGIGEMGMNGSIVGLEWEYNFVGWIMMEYNCMDE